MKYNIVTITSRDEIEQLGTKEKFWFYDTDETKKLFKIGRPGTGEDWAEKIAYELAKLLGLPCAKYEFAQWEGRQGTVSTSFVPESKRLIHGNELLVVFHDDEYPKTSRYHLSDYKLDVVLKLIESDLGDLLRFPENYEGNSFVKKPIDLFIGYLIFDCWVANQDRHHENWGIILGDGAYFAPTYDHAAGLGCKVSEEEAQKRLDTKDENYSIKKFVTRAKSPFYSNDEVQLKTIEVVEILAEKYPIVSCYWINKIDNIEIDNIQNIFGRVPNKFMGNSSKQFAQQILEENKIRLLRTKEEKCHE